jgi:hypothetical protein
MRAVSLTVGIIGKDIQLLGESTVGLFAGTFTVCSGLMVDPTFGDGLIILSCVVIALSVRLWVEESVVMLGDLDGSITVATGVGELTSLVNWALEHALRMSTITNKDFRLA